MPVYEFKCRECGSITAELRRMGDFTPPRCTTCRSSHMEKIFSLFAGSGKDCQSCSSAHAGG